MFLGTWLQPLEGAVDARPSVGRAWPMIASLEGLGIAFRTTGAPRLGSRPATPLAFSGLADSCGPASEDGMGGQLWLSEGQMERLRPFVRPAIHWIAG